MDEVLGKLDAKNVALAVQIASVPEGIRGYGPVKERHLKDARVRGMELLQELREPGSTKKRVAIPIKVAA